jgi:hypothetical protein
MNKDMTALEGYDLTMVTLNDGITWFEAYSERSNLGETLYWFTFDNAHLVMDEFIDSHKDIEGFSAASGDYDGLDDEFYWRARPDEVYETSRSFTKNGETFYAIEMEWSE